MGVVIVFHNQRHTVARAQFASLLEFRIELIGALQRIGIGYDDGIEPGRLIVFFDAFEIGADELPAGQVATLYGIVDIGNAGFDDIEVFRLTACDCKQCHNSDG